MEINKKKTKAVTKRNDRKTKTQRRKEERSREDNE